MNALDDRKEGRGQNNWKSWKAKEMECGLGNGSSGPDKGGWEGRID